MRRTLVALGVLSLLTACGEPSNVDPEAVVRISGSALHADGSPVTGGTVAVVKDIGVDDFAASAPLFFGTMGMACVVGADLDLCDEEGTRTELAEDGTFSVTLKGADVQSGFGTTSTLWASVGAPSAEGLGGASAAYAFTADSETVRLPPLRLWEPRVKVAQADGSIRVAWPDLPRRLGRQPEYQARFETSGGDLVWAAYRSGVKVDARVLEDVRGGVAVDASAEARDGAVTYRSPQKSFEGPGGPPSRGASCSAVATGRRTVTYEPCPLTDGVFGEDFDPALDPECAEERCPAHDTAIIVDLGEVRSLSLIVLRADPDTNILATSMDGSRWRRLATVRMRTPHVTVRGGATRTRYIRLSAQRWPLGTLHELSIW